MTQEFNNLQNTKEDEIDLIALVKTLWEQKKFIVKLTIAFSIVGLFIALLSPKEYTSSTTMVPQISSSSSKAGGLSSLAAMAGFNLNVNSNGQELSPMVYPQIVQSVPFQMELMNSTFYFPEIETSANLYDYYTNYHKPDFLTIAKKYTIGLPYLILNSATNKSNEQNKPEIDSKTIALTKKQEEIRKVIADNLVLETNDKDGLIVLRSTFHEATLSAQIAQKAQELLQQYITDFKIKKAAAQLEFIHERYQEKKHEFENAQAKLAEFRDRNKNVISAIARTQEERLQSDYQLAFNVYSELAKQLEQAQIQVKEDTPVFAVIKPVTVPQKKSKPNRLMILAIWVFLGIVFSITWIFGRQFISTVKTQWEETEKSNNQTPGE